MQPVFWVDEISCMFDMEKSEAKKAEILADVAYLLKVEATIKEGTGSFRKHRILFCTETIQPQSADRKYSDPGYPS